MIQKGKYDYLGKEYSYVSIDLADKKHKNRVLDIFEQKNTDGLYNYVIKAQWTEPRFHPYMSMEEDDVIELSNALNELVTEILDRRNKS